MNPLALISPRGWVWIGAVVACIGLWFAVVAGVRHYNESLREDGRAQVREQWKAEVKRGQDILDAKERTRLLAQEKADAQHSQALAAAAADAARADGAAQRLRVRVDALVAAARRQAAPGATPAGPGPGVQGADPLDVLADMQRRLDDAAGQLGSYADQLRVAGQLCEATHDALSAAPLVSSMPTAGPQVPPP